MSEYPHVFVSDVIKRTGQRCKIIGKSNMSAQVQVQFEDGFTAVVSRMALRRSKPKKISGMYEALSALDILDNASAHVRHQWKIGMNDAEASANMQARAILFNCSNLIRREQGMRIARDTLNRFRKRFEKFEKQGGSR